MLFNLKLYEISFIAVAIIFIGSYPVAFGQAQEVNLNTPFVLKVNQNAVIDSEITLTLLDIEEDSRCPFDVTCVWEGSVKAQIHLNKGQKNLGTHVIPQDVKDPDEQIFDNYFFRIVEVTPYPKSSTPIKPSEYSVTFLVSKITKDIDSPLKQFNMGVPINDIQCRGDLTLIIKSMDLSPACVKPKTAEKLVLRGWAEPIESQVLIQPIIRTGTNSGFCVGYCSVEFTITSEGLVYSETGREFVSDTWVDLPDKTTTLPISQEEWNQIIEVIDFEKFNSLPDKVGCPGCADAPVEWIEISYAGKTKKIEFEAREAIPEITQLIIKLQEIRTTTINSLIDSFEDCVFAGNPVMKSYPRQCMTTDGRNFVEDISPKINSPKSQCEGFDGEWLQEFDECEGISGEQCSTMGGVFEECASACRNMPDAQMCTKQCVLVCKIP